MHKKRVNKKCISAFFVVKRQHLLPLTKSAVNGMYVKYYPSTAFLPSVASTTF